MMTLGAAVLGLGRMNSVVDGPTRAVTVSQTVSVTHSVMTTPRLST